MRYDPALHHRRSVRLRGYDYATPGVYFVTICTYGRLPLLGVVADGRVRLGEAGVVAAGRWRDLPRWFPHVRLDAFVVMPDHVHGVIVITGGSGGSGMPGVATPDGPGERGVRGRRGPAGTTPGSLGAVVQWFKSATTRKVNRLRGTPGAPLWQRNYYERVVRDAREHEAVRRYIELNPVRWHERRVHEPAVWIVPDLPVRSVQTGRGRLYPPLIRS